MDEEIRPLTNDMCADQYIDYVCVLVKGHDGAHFSGRYVWGRRLRAVLRRKEALTERRL